LGIACHKPIQSKEFFTARFLMVILSVVLMGCAGGTPITDYSKRSVVYTWLDVSEVSGNNLNLFMMRNLRAPKDEKFYSMGWEKLGNGYVIWHNGFDPGSYEFHKMQLMSCLGVFCTNTINEYDFGPDGTAPGKLRVAGPGVSFAGCYALRKTKRGFFRPGEFDTRKSRCGASRQQMLSIILKSAPAEHPIVTQRIRRAMGR
jgi:hypothetical protein